MLQVGSVWEQRVAAQNFDPSLERAVSRSSELFVFGPSLELGFLRSSERLRLGIDLRVMFLGSNELFFARASVLSLERASGCRPEGLSCWLERSFLRSGELLGCWLERGFSVSGHSSDQVFARASLFYLNTQQRF